MSFKITPFVAAMLLAAVHDRIRSGLPLSSRAAANPHARLPHHEGSMGGRIDGLRPGRTR